MKKTEKTVGQLELSVKKFKGRDIRYVHLFYLIAEKRGKGYSPPIQTCAMDFFKSKDLDEYHLAWEQKSTTILSKERDVETGPELEGEVIRMQGFSLQFG